MIRKIKILLLIVCFIPSCGFSPIYSSKNIRNISIEQINFNGDRTLNNYLRSNLNRYKNNDEANPIINNKIIKNNKLFTIFLTEYLCSTVFLPF